MATHSSILAWRIPGTEEPGGLQPMGEHTVRHDWSNLVAAAAVIAYWAKFCLQLNICYLYFFNSFEPGMIIPIWQKQIESG